MKLPVTTLILLSGMAASCVEASPVFTTLISFAGINGANPKSGLVQSADGDFYGTTEYGGTNNYGTLFRVTPSGSLANPVFFNHTNGAGPRAGLTKGADGSFYGTAYSGGAQNAGTIFKFTTNGVFSMLASFANTNGAYPIADLVPGQDGNFYGTTAIGGTNINSGGAVIKVAPSGVVTPVVSFSTGSTNGDSLYGRVIQTADGNLHGTTYYGGVHGFGTLFKTTTNGNLTSLYSFGGASDGANPFAGLVQGADGYLYGSTYNGGTNGHGTLFRLATNGVFSTLFSFGNTNGANPQAALVSGPDGALYGTTTSGGLFTNALGQGYGTIFKLTTNSVFTSLVSFANTNGAGPQGTLMFGVDGNLYGTTANGGSNDLGVVFRLSLASPTPPVFQSITKSANTLTLIWSTLAGQTYRIQSNTNLSTTNWSNVGSTILATNSTATISDIVGPQAQRFYRALLLP
ncbi:MAG: hypothetical protein HOP33_11285 [Verrucomicrobia bacterium]|nr:hypothetical protein [Verrucomicrobiota bacterium]